MAEEKENVQISEEELKKFENIKAKIAEGMVFICPKHGDCTENNLFLSYLKKSGEEVQQVKHIYCAECLDNLLQSLVSEGKLGNVKIGIKKDVLNELGVTSEDLNEDLDEEKIE